MAENNSNIHLLARLSLAEKGLSACLFNNENSIPRLIAGDAPENFQKEEHYRFKYLNNNTTNISYSMLGMLPGMTDNNINNNFKHWRNPKRGLYPIHDDNPIITMQKYSVDYSSNLWTGCLNTIIDMLPSSIMIVSEKSKKTDYSSHKYNWHPYITKQESELTRSSISTDAKLNQTIIECSKNNKGGIIVLNQEKTSISRNSHVAGGIKILLNTRENGYCGLQLTNTTASLTTKNLNNGIFVNEDTANSAVTIMTNGECIARFDNSITTIGCAAFESNGVALSDNFYIKLNPISGIQENIFKGKGQKISAEFKQILINNTARMKTTNSHINTIHGFIEEELETSPEIHGYGYTDFDHFLDNRDKKESRYKIINPTSSDDEISDFFTETPF